MFLQLEAILGIIMPHILIAGRDWTARALLRAQLLEEGFDVEAHEDVTSALNSLRASKTMPQLLVADLFESENPQRDAELLTKWVKHVPIWVLAGHATGVAAALEGRVFERVLYRPLDMGKLVEEIKERLAG
jgi:DNA-binding NtrC family response regulator